MIQELLGGGGGAGFIGGEQRKISIGGIVLEGSSPSSSSPSSSATTTTTSNTANTTTTSSSEQLRCPRCDSSNTKFCYYNNYNLTQPRHFCKTCRRYWTKGGALRNIPIGGGCRKNKSSTSVSPTPPGKAITSGKVKAVVSNEIGKSNLGSGGFIDHELLPSNPINLWPSPQNSQLLALLRATQNPNHISSSVNVKEEAAGMIGSHMTPSESGERTLILDPMNQVPLGLCNSFWRNNQHHHQPLQQNQNQNIQQQPHSFLLGHEAQNTEIQELYQRLRSSGNYYYNNHSSTVLSNQLASSSSISEPAHVAGGELGYWNQPLSWSDLPTTNGAYP